MIVEPDAFLEAGLQLAFAGHEPGRMCIFDEFWRDGVELT